MLRIIFFSLWVLAGSMLQAQPPEDYYDAAEGLDGEALKAALHNIIKGHTEYPYTSSSTDVWDILKETDRDTANSANVILFYTGWSVNAAQEYNGGSGWNREHVWAKSRGDFGTSPGPGTDVHHLRPADISVNSARSNRWFDKADEPYYDDGQPTGCFTSSTTWVWEPRNAVKGDVARMIFYMATRYEGDNGEPDLEMIDYFPDDIYTKAPVHALKSTLLKWHQEDPVDDFERHRNEVVYQYQHNRNPFIDHPEYAERIWESPQGASLPAQRVEIAVYPNPARDYVVVNRPDGYTVTLHTITGRKVTTTTSQTISLDVTGNGIYLIIITDAAGTRVATRRLVVRR